MESSRSGRSWRENSRPAPSQLSGRQQVLLRRAATCCRRSRGATITGKDNNNNNAESPFRSGPAIRGSSSLLLLLNSPPSRRPLVASVRDARELSEARPQVVETKGRVSQLERCAISSPESAQRRRRRQQATSVPARPEPLVARPHEAHPADRLAAGESLSGPLIIPTASEPATSVSVRPAIIFFALHASAPNGNSSLR